MKLPEERDLLQRARQLDEQALAEIYDAYSPGIYRYAVRLMGDVDQAEDCVAETFSRFLHALHREGGPQEFLKAYLYRVAHNWITDQYRRQPPPTLPLEHELLCDPQDSPVAALEQSLEQQRVRKALYILTAEQRQVILLKYLEGWDNAEIARSLQKPVGAVKSLQHRALQALKRILLVKEETQL